MFDFLFSLRNKAIGLIYKNLLKQIFFRLDPEFVHDRMNKNGQFLGKFWMSRKLTSAFFSYQNKVLEQNILGIRFKNPIGLSAGFDKDAELTKIIPCVGFGFEEIGSITGELCPGNPRPRLWRLKKSKSLVVYYGLKNKGSEEISQRLKHSTFNIPVGISIAKTNSKNTVEERAGIADYVRAFKKFTDIGDYYTINISCPNAYGGQPFTNHAKLNNLLSELDKIPTKKPVFLKISPDLSTKELDKILEVSKKHKVHGFVCSNLTKNRKNRKIKDLFVPKVGGLSGKVLKDLSDDLIKYIYEKTKGEYVIIGCGGVFSAEDAYRKIKLGASLIQLITGMIFEGPQLISDINLGLVKLLKKDGLTNISEATRGRLARRPLAKNHLQLKHL